MTDRVNYLIVALEHDIRVDDIEPTIEAIKHLRGVLNVKANISDASQWLADERARNELGGKILEVIFPEKMGS